MPVSNVLSNMLMVGSYDFRLVALSIFIAILASYAALDLAGRVTCSRGGARLLWLGGGAVAMGTGVWSMHYVGMLAFHLPITVLYDWPTALAAGGRYYLPYRLHATPAQFRRAYPQADEFFNLKRRYDPQELFQNQFYVKYGTDPAKQQIQSPGK
jgi:hypothetical protein